jgi:hypothetical protein
MVLCFAQVFCGLACGKKKPVFCGVFQAERWATEKITPTSQLWTSSSIQTHDCQGVIRLGVRALVDMLPSHGLLFWVCSFILLQ